MCNLRLCNQGINTRNRHNKTKTMSGQRGVYKHRGKWQVKFMVNGNRKYVGSFNNLNDAIIESKKFIKMYA